MEADLPARPRPDAVRHRRKAGAIGDLSPLTSTRPASPGTVLNMRDARGAIASLLSSCHGGYPTDDQLATTQPAFADVLGLREEIIAWYRRMIDPPPLHTSTEFRRWWPTPSWLTRGQSRTVCGSGLRRSTRALDRRKRAIGPRTGTIVRPWLISTKKSPTNRFHDAGRLKHRRFTIRRRLAGDVLCNTGNTFSAERNAFTSRRDHRKPRRKQRIAPPSLPGCQHRQARLPPLPSERGSRPQGTAEQRARQSGVQAVSVDAIASRRHQNDTFTALPFQEELVMACMDQCVEAAFRRIWIPGAGSISQ